jgi:acyl-CoA thioester hydrolase
VTSDCPRRRGDYTYFHTIETRWNDNDVYGHMNNVVYYEMFDSVINRYLIGEGGLDIVNGSALGIIPETRCRYRKPLHFPDVLDVGLRVTRLGRSSVVYDAAMFRQGDDDAAAECHFVHVFVDRADQGRTVPIPNSVRAALALILVGD